MYSSPIAIVMAGGHGKRMGPLAECYGCKSLILIQDKPAISYVIETLLSVTDTQIILCIEREELAPKIQSTINHMGVRDCTKIYYNPLLKGTIHSLYLLKESLLDRPVFMFYGHQPFSQSHYTRLLAKESDELVVSLYGTSSNNSRKIAVLGKDGAVVLLTQGTSENSIDEKHLYIDVPYKVPNKFLLSQSNEYIRTHDAIEKWLLNKNIVTGIQADFPHEFHYEYELDDVGHFINSGKHVTT